jgi:glycerol uptake facilitator-like aquaporin
MATRKATSSKAKRPTTKKAVTRSSSKRSTKTIKPTIIEEDFVEIVEVVDSDEAAADAGKPKAKLSFKQKLVAIRPGALIAELLGTFVLAAVVIKLVQGGTTGTIGIGLALAVLVIVFGVVSGAHLNPAITIAQYVNRKIDGVKTVAYVIAQVLGAMLAFAILYGIFQSSYNDSIITALAAQGITKESIDAAGGLAGFAEQTQYGTIDGVAEVLGIQPFINVTIEKGQELIVLLSEILGAVVFGLGVGYAVLNNKKGQVATGLAVGLSLFAGLAIGGVNVILNPAVASAIGGFGWGGALFGEGAMTFWWPVFTYVFGTVIGLTAGFTIYRFILKDVLAKR